jgi:hypothetical protein
MNIIKSTKSICPECLIVLDATIFEEDGKVFIKKECPEHGPCQELYCLITTTTFGRKVPQRWVKAWQTPDKD